MTPDMKLSEKKKIIAVVGPTASGKSGLAINIAEKFGGTIVGCDSMQIYRGMNIGTAKPTQADTARVPHVMFDIVSPDEMYSCADYVRDAAAAIGEIHKSGRIPVLCGGTGLYLDSLLTPRSYGDSAGRTALRDELEAIAGMPDGKAILHRMLAEVDPVSAAAIHENNVRRVIRAIEIFRESGVPKSELDRRSRESAAPLMYDALVIGLRYTDRAVLRARIARRVDEMLAAGLADEVRRLDAAGVFSPLPDGSMSTAAQAIGYKEMLAAVRAGDIPDSVREAVITATARYAKRQMTWFGSKPYVRWIDIPHAGYDPTPQAFAMAETFIKE